MRANIKQYGQALFELVDGVEDKQTLEQRIEKFVKILIDFNQVAKVDKILQHFSKLWNEKNNVVNAEIISAHELDEEVKNLIKDYIYKLSQAEQVDIKEKIDSDILGGVVIKYGDNIIDNSLKQRVNKLKTTIK